MIELLLFGSFFLFLALGIPVAFSLGLSAVTVLITTDGLQVLDVVPSVMFPSMSSGTLLAIPFFVLAGIIMQYTGISQRLIDLAFIVFGRFSHGLAAVTIISAFFFSAISGSGPATVAAIGAILIPALVRNGYAKKHAISLVAASGSMGIVVPPSIAFIIFAVVASEYGSISISRLFIAGIVPGIIMAAAFFIAAFFVPRVRDLAGLPVKSGRGSRSETTGAEANAASAGATASAGTSGTRTLTSAGPGGTAHPGSSSGVGSGDGPVPAPTDTVDPNGGLAEFLSLLVKAIPGLLIPVIILGGIYGGIFTPTEAGAVASVFALAVGIFVYRELKWTDLPKVFLESGVSTAVIMFIVGVASLFSYVITVEGVADRVSTAVLGVTDNKFVILAVITIILLIVGAFVDAISAFYLFIPILVPILIGVGVDMTTIGVFMTVNLAIGLFTPPVGLNLYVGAGIGKARLEDVVRGILPFLICAIIALLLITYIPAISNWLPDILGVG
ncbi:MULTISPECIES: TRAP transporter large permease [unclassified Brevibacterium]|uniref:TRAP transporter large permease n=1 Tax=unclassified Brevibacterium TaxID=2614124 RepID=UPI001E3C5F30|nr:MULTISPECIES: TRAP transporter large permease [unclassified Brevibacterium]MCD1286173.1 TRAP transporter large permease [Brevibacterium sp. CCUG 69071]MDK8433532.1 TRAP transporter large permease [Brevibacterium sp. H-BE7]